MVTRQTETDDCKFRIFTQLAGLAIWECTYGLEAFPEILRVLVLGTLIRRVKLFFDVTEGRTPFVARHVLTHGENIIDMSASHFAAGLPKLVKNFVIGSFS